MIRRKFLISFLLIVALLCQSHSSDSDSPPTLRSLWDFAADVHVRDACAAIEFLPRDALSADPVIRSLRGQRAAAGFPLKDLLADGNLDRYARSLLPYALPWGILFATFLTVLYLHLPITD